MCVTIIIHNYLNELPLIIGNNRDEYVSRNFAPPLVLNKSPLVIGAKDLARGGTWLGINENNIFLNLLNKWSKNKNFFGSKDYKSRGTLVLNLLKLTSLKYITESIFKINDKEYLPFYLIASDIKKVLLFEFDNSLKLYDISNRIFILGNKNPFSSWVKFETGYNFLKKNLSKDLNKIKKVIKTLLSYQKGSQTIPSEDYTVNLGYFQTTSSTILEFYQNNELNYFFANGKAFNSNFQNYSFLLKGGKSV